MDRKNNGTLYVGLALVIIGTIFFLDLNGWLPNNFFGQYLNILIGLVLLSSYFKTRKLSLLMLTTFFLTNGAIIVIDSLFIGYNYIAAIFLIPGVMLLVAFSVKKRTALIIPGAISFCWGIYIFFVSIGVIFDFAGAIGMFFMANSIAFLIICTFDKARWASMISGILAVMGIMIIAMGLGPVSRNVLFQVLAVLLVVSGIIIIVRGKLSYKEQSQEREDE